MSETTPEATASAPPAPEADEAKGYAVYDETELRFRGVVHPTRAKATEAKADIAKGLAKGRDKSKAKHRLTVKPV